MFGALGPIGNLFSLVLTYPILNALIVLDHLFGDFGLAIVVLTLVIKLILFPLTLQQLKSTKATQALQPEMAKIKEKYGNDQQGQALAMQTLYKEYGVNPMAGCLPMFIQLPVLYCLYFALRVALDSKLPALQSLLYPFVRPLITRVPDPTFTWLSWLQVVNPLLHIDFKWTFALSAADPTHVLPILAGLATFLSLRMTQANQPKPNPSIGKSTSSSALDATQSSMKMMMYIMPFFTVFIGWNIASGLALYWTVSSIFQAVQQYFVTGLGGLKPAPVSAPAKKTKVQSSTSSFTKSTPARPKNSIVEGSLGTVPQASKSPVANGQVRPASASVNGGGGAGLSNASSRDTSSGSQYNRRPRSGSASARRRNRR